MSEFFKNGGYGMFPTLVVGLFLLATAVLYAVRPSGRRARVALVLGTVTLASGLLGASAGMATTAHFIPQVPKGDQLEILAVGFGESIHNVVLALVVVVLAGLVASVGALRASDEPSPRGA
ncbi:MAG: hypothetical protein IPK71_03305 [Myxococcales bacterium]|jgi:hypothetical protein|nr:hypothetical protein [Myxococcales bacterium]MBL9112322.1 hypothetical protein [Myxococcales bacterium]